MSSNIAPGKQCKSLFEQCPGSKLVRCERLYTHEGCHSAEVEHRRVTWSTVEAAIPCSAMQVDHEHVHYCALAKGHAYLHQSDEGLLSYSWDDDACSKQLSLPIMDSAKWDPESVRGYIPSSEGGAVRKAFTGPEFGKALVDNMAIAAAEHILTSGVKHDHGKPPLDLLPFEALLEVAKVLDFGAKKYARNNWRSGFLWSRLLAAALRHLFAWGMGERKDPETGLSHLAHAACMVLFLITHEVKNYGTDDCLKGSEEKL